MADLKNKRFHINAIDIIVALIFVAVLIAGAFFLKKYYQINDLYNIARTDVDFIVMAPTQSQVEEIRSQSHVESAVPYVFRTSDISINQKSVKANVVIIENEADLSKTVFSDKLLLTSSKNDLHNPIFISDEFAELTGLKTGDSFKISINGTPVEFSVKSIYKSDHRTVGGIVLAIMNDDVLSALGNKISYNGVYIHSNDISQTRSFFETFIPEGDLRTREDFDSDEAYEIYLKDRQTVKSSEYITDIETVLKNIAKKNDASRLRNLIVTIIIAVLDVVLISIVPLVRANSYIKNNVRRDVRNGFKIKQETAMFRGFFVGDTCLLVASYIVGLFLVLLLFKINVISLFSCIGIALILIIMISISSTSNSKLDKEFARQVKIYEEEKKKLRLANQNNG